MCAQSLLWCLTLCDPMDCSLPDSSNHGIFQARILEWVAISSFRGSSWPRDRAYVSCVACIARVILYSLSHQGSPNGKVESKSESRSVVSDSLWPHGLYSPWNSPGQNTGVGSCFLLQGTFPTQGSNPGLPHCEGILYQLSHEGSPVFLKC